MYLATEAICVVQWLICTLVLLRLVLIGSKDLDGGETSDAILTTQWLVLVCIYSTNLDNTLKDFRTDRLECTVSTFIKENIAGLLMIFLT